MAEPLRLRAGVKTDPIEYRYSYEWLFRLMAEEGVYHCQVGSFFELYQLPDSFFLWLRDQAEIYGVALTSGFTAHRELGGFFRREPGFVEVARRNYERFIEAASLLGARYVGSNPGAVLRDEFERKPQAVAAYLDHMKELMAYAKTFGLEALTMEPMSCLAEPPMLPEELRGWAETLNAHHADAPGQTVPARYCSDTSHGYADANRNVVHTHMALLEATLPWMVEVHLKNTDACFDSTFGFSKGERERGIVDLQAVRDLFLANAAVIPVDEVIGYLEIGGPKTGRDYSDPLLEGMLRESLRHCREAYEAG